MRRAPDHDHHALAGPGIADAGLHGDQLIRYDPLVPLELPVRPAGAQAQMLAGEAEAATATFERAVAAINDVGLLAEEPTKLASVTAAITSVSARRGGPGARSR
jgi:hypothetical protein